MFEGADIGKLTMSRDPEQTKKLFEKYKPTHVIHLAALGTRSIFTGLIAP